MRDTEHPQAQVNVRIIATTPDDAAAPSVPAGVVGKHHSREVGYLFAAVGAVLFSTKAIIVKLAYGVSLDPETLLALRMGFSLPFYIAIGVGALKDRWRRELPLPGPRQWMNALLVGLLGYWFASYTDFLGLEYISAQFERLILFTYPLFVVLMGAAFFGQPVRRRILAAFAISYFGLAVIFSENFSLQGANVAIGTGLVFASSIAFALYQLLAKEVMGGMGPRLFTCMAMTGAGFGAFAQFFAGHPANALMVSGRPLAYAVLIAIGATVIPSFFLNAALYRISAQANGAIGTISPIATILLSALILGEPLTLTGVAGALLVIAGIGWFTFAGRRRE
jgi:drug/metabolite transporter (DMT)-like permease